LRGYYRVQEIKNIEICVLCLMGTRAERKEDFVGGFGFGVVENSHKDVMVLPHHHYYPSYSSPSSSSLCYCSAGVSDPMFSVSSNQAYTSSHSGMFTPAGSGSAAVTVADPFFSLSSSGFKFSPFC